jgi:hypothetical protein
MSTSNTQNIQAGLDAILMEKFIDRASASGLLTSELKGRIMAFATATEGDVPRIGVDAVLDFLLTRNGF